VNPLRVLQVGVGAHGRNWARHVIPNIPEVELVGYVDTDPAALELLCEEAGVAHERCHQSFADAVAATEPEAVLVTTSLPGHVPVVGSALGAGLHVLVEKPFAPNLAEAQELVDMAAYRGLTLMVSQNYRFFPAPRALAAFVRGGSLGELFEVSIDFRRWSPAPNGRRRHHFEAQPLLVDMSIHHFDLLRLVLDSEPVRVYCEASNPAWTPFSGPSVATAAIAFEGGAFVSYRGSWITAGPVTPWAGEWRLEFERGEVVWTGRDDDPRLDRVLVRPRGGRVRGLALRPQARTGPAGTLTEFADAVRSGREPETSGRDNLGTIALMDAAVDSATRHQPVSIFRTGEALAI
jgi:predicted dehydrogenase